MHYKHQNMHLKTPKHLQQKWLVLIIIEQLFEYTQRFNFKVLTLPTH